MRSPPTSIQHIYHLAAKFFVAKHMLFRRSLFIERFEQDINSHASAAGRPHGANPWGYYTV